jgi:hypothetical protein
MLSDYGIDGVSIQEKIETIKNLPTPLKSMASKEIIVEKPKYLFLE